MESKHNPKNIEFELQETERGDFHIGQCYDNTPAKTLICSVCGNDRFIVGKGSYFIAIKCDKCEYETCIHDG